MELKTGTIVFHKKRKQFGSLVDGIGRPALQNLEELIYEVEVEDHNPDIHGQWYVSNMVILKEDTPQKRLALQIKYAD
jgi:hypothetical protein